MEEDFLAPPRMEDYSLSLQSPLPEINYAYSIPMLHRRFAPRPIVAVRSFVRQGKHREIEDISLHRIPKKTTLAIRCTDEHLGMCKLFDKKVAVGYIVVRYHGLNDAGSIFVEYLEWQPKKPLWWLPFENIGYIVPIELDDCLVFNLGKDGRISRIRHELLLKEVQSNCSKMGDDDELTIDESEILESPSVYSPSLTPSSESLESSELTKCNHCYEKEVSLIFKCWDCKHGTCGACSVRCPKLPVDYDKYAYIAMQFNDCEHTPIEIIPEGFLEKEDMYKYIRENGEEGEWYTYLIRLREPTQKGRTPRKVKSKYQIKNF